jgi:hypothetical protein
MIGSTEKDGGQIKERPVSPGDLAATIYRYFGLPLDLTYEDATGRIHNLLPHGGESIRELFAQLNFLTDQQNPIFKEPVLFDSVQVQRRTDSLE